MNRRSFLAAGAASALSLAAPAIPLASAAAGDVDVAIIGAGAAGIAAARRLAAAKRSYRVLEAAPRVGGRCRTDTELFGAPCDLGAHWLHLPELNSLTKLAPQTGLEVYPAPRAQKVRIGRRDARAGEMEDYLSASVRADRAIRDAARGRADVAAGKALPQDLGDWQATIAFVLGPFACGRDLADVSAMDFARALERETDAFCRQGLGTLLAALAAGLRIETATPVTQVDWRGGIEIETPRGKFAARALIVTAPTSVLLADRIRFTPDLPKRQKDALAQLKLGSYDHIILELPGNPFGLQRDELVFEKTDNNKTAALLANIAGSPLAMVEVAGSFGRDLSRQGDKAMIAFARDWLGNLYGEDVKNAIKRAHATRWNAEPLALGAASVASVNGHGARRVLMEPLNERIYFAGEAAHETLWGTVGGAWESGERAADAILKRLAPPVAAAKREQAKPSRKKSRQRQ